MNTQMYWVSLGLSFSAYADFSLSLTHKSFLSSINYISQKTLQTSSQPTESCSPLPRSMGPLLKGCKRFLLSLYRFKLVFKPELPCKYSFICGISPSLSGGIIRYLVTSYSVSDGSCLLLPLLTVFPRPVFPCFCLRHSQKGTVQAVYS